MTDVMVELHALNPAPADAEAHDAAWSDAALLAEIDTRSGTDMSLDQKPRTERAKAVEGPRRWSRGLVAAAAFAVVVVVIGIVALARDGGGPTETSVPPATTVTTAVPTTTTPVPTTSIAPTPTLSTEQQAFVDAYFHAWNNDVDAQLGLLSPDLEVFVQSGVWHPFAFDPQPVERQQFEQIARWGSAIGTEASLTECEPRDNSVLCRFAMTDPLVEAINDPQRGTMEFSLVDGLAIVITVRWAPSNQYYDHTRSFQVWLDDNHPEQSSLMMVASGEPVYTEESAQLWSQLLPRFLGQDAPLATDEAAFVNSFFDAWNNDIDAYLALFDPSAEIGRTFASKYGPWVTTGEFVQTDWPTFEAMSRWEAWMDTESTVDAGRCFARATQIVCPFETTDPFIAATMLRLQAVATFELTDGSISRLEMSWSNSANGDANEFEEWLYRNHPTVAPDMVTIAGEPVPTERSAELWKEYIPLYIKAVRGG